MVAPAVLFGIASGGMSIANSISGHMDATNKARAQNQQRVQQYRNQLRLQQANWAKDRAVFSQKIGQYKEGLGERQKAYSRAVGDSMLGLDETYRAAQVGQLQRSQELAGLQGAAAAAGRRGSGLRADMNPLGQYVQGQGMMMDNLLRARYGAERQISGFRDQLMASNRRAHADVAFAPMKPLPIPKPIQQSGPSGMSLALGIGSGILSGVSAAAGAGGTDPTQGMNKAFGWTG